MTRLYLLLLLPFLLSCEKNNKSSNNASIDGVDLNDVLNTDDYFKAKKRKAGSAKDSIQTRIVDLNDINSDGIKDTAFIRYNTLNSVYKVSFTCFPGLIHQGNVAELLIKNIGDLNNDGNSEIMFFLQSEESCWDEIKLYSFTNNKWSEKYNGLTYQCTNTSNTNYQFRKLNEHTVQLITYGINKDSIDIISGDTLENIIPNAQNSNLIVW